MAAAGTTATLPQRYVTPYNTSCRTTTEIQLTFSLLLPLLLQGTAR
jgi:hypothetical protein